MDSSYTLAIVGMGPRGLFALEQVLEKVGPGAQKLIRILAFEETPYPGCGPVYRQDQPHSNWLNLPERLLVIPPRKNLKWDDLSVPGFPDYQEWAGISSIDESAEDQYPPRAVLGRYLKERFETLVKPLSARGIFTLINKRIDSCSPSDNGVILQCSSGEEFEANEVVLTVGYQPTEISEENKVWFNHSNQDPNAHFLTDPYPIHEILDKLSAVDTNLIILKGFGLSMIDVARGITEAVGGKFHLDTADTSEDKIQMPGEFRIAFVPYSLDGLPLAPKPWNARIDSQFTPEEKESQKFSRSLDDFKNQSKGDISVLIDSISTIAAGVYSRFPGDSSEGDSHKTIIKKWLQDPAYTHSLIVEGKLDAFNSMQNYVSMAMGKIPPSLDFCTGQVWRHLKGIMNEFFSHSELPDETIVEALRLNERMKRFSYGPPVASIRQMIALVKADMMMMDYVDDPKVRTINGGWELESNKQTLNASILVDTVLDSPKVMTVTAPLLVQLLNDDLVKPMHSELGLETYSNGLIKSDSETLIPVAFLGRLAKGSVFEADSILRSFGKEITDWAVGLRERRQLQ